MRNVAKFLIVLSLALGFFVSPALSQNRKRVILQAFWWDYWHPNYAFGWANYLTELAPRLKGMGIDAVWIPPITKDNNRNVGYSVFDHYDLGDKFQKGSLGTRLGDKDELLRMIAVMHANGIEVIQDVVLNHVDNAGSATGGNGGQDAFALSNYNDGTTQGFKNFRYVSYATPANDETATNYLNRSGRWLKNWPNFYPNQFNACCNNDINSILFGPDISFESNAFGQSSCVGCFNPPQSSNYMRDNARNWLIWSKKQTGVDGYRFDAVKHFPASIVEDLLWNTQNNAGFASGGNDMFAVGEWVGGASALDSWANATQNRSGTFDFALRSGLYNIISGGGNFDMGSLPSLQQSNRWRTVPFVNNHDTFRPQLNSSGNYSGWNTGQELAPHIDPFDGRLSVAYAVACAVDGSPQIFFEDLFNVSNSNRYTHAPTNTTQLPTRGDLENILWCHQNLRFKEGAYKVRWQAQDLLIIERSGKAIICANDSWNNWQDPNGVQTDFPDGTQLKDYSGAAGNSIRTVYGGGKANLSVPPCNGTALQGRRGYSIWAPVGINQNYNNNVIPTIQEWELDDDLGDSHASSLGQGGRLPGNSTAWRRAGKVFSNSGTTISVNLFPSDNTRNLTLAIFNMSGTQVASVSGTGNLTLNFTPTAIGFYMIKARHTNSINYAGQKVWIKAQYTAPATVSTSAHPSRPASGQPMANRLDIERPIAADEEGGFRAFPNPAERELSLQIPELYGQTVEMEIVDMVGKQQQTETIQVNESVESIKFKNLKSGIYIIKLKTANGELQKKLMIK
ncbi:MAG: alpha-amylase family glycosyl hydrolase [Microscillaceae bacterium]|jgi:alpha-amylase|nr:alpha-amylase family glycosyl hydrolase [Microscillaceae bacterium]